MLKSAAFNWHVVHKRAVETIEISNYELVTIPLDESWARRELVMGVRDYKSLPPVTKPK